MRRKNNFIKVTAVFVILLSLFASVMLTGCKETDEIKGSITEIEDGNEKRDQILASLQSSQKELKELLDTVKETADKAATQAKLTEISEKVSQIENVAASKAALDAVKSELEALAVTVSDKSSKKEVTDLIAQVTELANTVGSNKEAANNAIEELKASINNTLKQSSDETNAKFEQIVAKIEGVDSASKDALNAVKSELEALKATVANKSTVDGLIATVTELANTVDSNKEATNEALVKLSESVKAAKDEAIAKADENAQAKLDALDSKLQKLINGKASTEALNEVKAELEALKATVANKSTVDELIATVTELANTVDANKEATDTALAELNNNLTSKIENLETELKKSILDANTDISDVSARVDELETKIANLNNAQLRQEIDTLKENIGTLNTTISGISETVNGKIDIEEYRKATELLYGDGEYSLNNFDNIRHIVEDEYDDDVVADFNSTADRLKFFLNRALTEDQIKEYFKELIDKKNSLKTLEQSFEERLNGISEGSVDLSDENKAKFDALSATYNKIVLKGLEIDESLINDYNVKTASYEALKDAKQEADFINGKINEIRVDALVFGQYETNLALIKDTYIPALESKEAFTNENYLIWYTDEVKNPENMLSMDNYNAILARDTQLQAAYAEFTSMQTLAVRNFNTALPSYTLRDEVKAQYETYLEIVETYELNEVNIKAMLKVEDGVFYHVLLDNANKYLAQFTDEVTGRFDTLKETIAKYVVNGDIRYSDKEEILGVQDTIDALKAEIMAFDVFGSLDSNEGNLDALLVMNDTSDVDTEYGKLTARIAELDEAVLKIEVLTSEVDATIAVALEALAKQNEEIFPYNTIFNALNDYKGRYESIMTDYSISDEEGTNNCALLTDVKAKIYNSYESDPKGLDGIYVQATAALKETVESLITMFEELGIEIVEEYNGKYASFDIKVPLSYRDSIVAIYNILSNNFEAQRIVLPGLEEVNIRTLINNVTALQRAYDKTLKEAVDAYNGIVSDISSVNMLATNDVRNHEAYCNALDLIIATIETPGYLDKIEGDTITEKLVYINGLDAFFSSITIDEMDTAVCATFEANYSAINTLYSTFDSDWEQLKAKMDGLMASAPYTVHSIVDFNATKAEFENYIAKYYANTTPDTVGDVLRDETTLYASFLTELAAAQGVADDANAEYEAIVSAINALIAKYNWDVTPEVIGAARGEYADIMNRISEFWTTYCPTHTDCSCVTEYADLIEDSDLLIALEIGYSKVLLTEEYYRCLAEETNDEAKENLTEYFKGMFRDNFEAAIGNVQTVDDVKIVFEAYVEMVNS